MVEKLFNYKRLTNKELQDQLEYFLGLYLEKVDSNIINRINQISAEQRRRKQKCHAQ